MNKSRLPQCDSYVKLFFRFKKVELIKKEGQALEEPALTEMKLMRLVYLPHCSINVKSFFRLEKPEQ